MRQEVISFLTIDFLAGDYYPILKLRFSAFQKFKTIVRVLLQAFCTTHQEVIKFMIFWKRLTTYKQYWREATFDSGEPANE